MDISGIINGSDTKNLLPGRAPTAQEIDQYVASILKDGVSVSELASAYRSLNDYKARCPAGCTRPIGLRQKLSNEKRLCEIGHLGTAAYLQIVPRLEAAATPRVRDAAKQVLDLELQILELEQRLRVLRAGTD